MTEARALTDRLGGILVFVMLLLGGAGLYYPLVQCAIELLALVLIAVSLPVLVRRRRDPGLSWPLLCAAAVPLLLILQLVPLPPAIWTSLPGRELATSVANQAGLEDRWYPLSLTPDATSRVLLSLLPPLATFVWVTNLSLPRRYGVLGIMACVAAVGAVLGAFQIAYTGSSTFHIFDTSHLAVATGLFTNRNHHATELLIAIPALAAWGRFQQRAFDHTQFGTQALYIVGGGTILFSVGVLSTASRTGFALLPLALLAAGLIFWRGSLSRIRIAAMAAAAMGGAALLSATHLAERALSRFETVDNDLRPDFWSSTYGAIENTLPWGTGFGSFPSYYPSQETLDQITPAFPNHAHSDWLEIVLEGGVPALLLAVTILAFAAFNAIKAVRRGGRSSTLNIAALAGLAIIALHSLDDYPVRMTALAMVLAALLAFVIPTPKAAVPVPEQAPARKGRKTAWTIGLIAIAAIAIRSLAGAIGAHALLVGAPDVAVRVAPWMADAWAAYAVDRLYHQNYDEASTASLNALSISPIDVAAVRTLGYTQAAQGQDQSARATMRIAGQLSWRDLPTQAWLVDRAMQEGDMTIVTLRLDALMRQNIARDLSNARLGEFLSDPAVSRAMAQRLAGRPRWRGSFFYALGRAASADLTGIELLLRQMRDTGAPATPEEIGALVAQLIQSRRDADAARIWHSTGQQAGLADGSFEGTTGPLRQTNPTLRWSSQVPRAMSAVIGPIDRPWNGNAVSIASDGLRGGAPLQQWVLLSPGRYRLQSVIRIENAQPTLAVWTVACRNQGRAAEVARIPIGDVVRDDWRSSAGLFDVPAADCPVQMISFLVEPQERGAYRIRVDDVSIRPAQ